MPIEVGDRLPDATFFVMTPDGPAPRTVAEEFGGKRAVLFGVPGAFTPTCHRNHLAGFLAQADAIRAKGVDVIAVTGVNDVHVFDAWAKASGGVGVIDFLSDGGALFAKALGLTFDGTERGMGVRSQRYSMILDDRVVTTLAVEETPRSADLSGAAALLAALDQHPRP